MAPGRKKKNSKIDVNHLIKWREQQNIDNDFFREEEKLKSPSKYVDRISGLPDEILVHIISLLTSREAKTTKLLSRRWRRLDPIGHTISLCFPFPIQWKKGRLGSGYVRVGDAEKISDLINQMKRGLESYNYNGTRVIKLLRMDIPSTHLGCGGNMKLVEFAVSMETETLDIRMVYGNRNPNTERETLNPLLHVPESISSSRPGFKSIKDLSLSGVGMYRFDINSMLKNFVALERLSIDSPQILIIEDKHYRDANVISVRGYPECKLKHLLLSNITRNEYCIEVRDVVNLVSLKCNGLGVHALYLDNLPNLAHLGANFLTATHDTGNFQYCHDSLGEYYNSKTQDKVFTHNNLQLYTLPLHRIKHLELNVVMDKGSSVQQLFPIIKAFPHLEKLEIKFTRLFEPEYNEQIWQRIIKLYKKDDRVNKLTMMKRRSNFHHLKTAVRLSEFSGSVFELEFALCVIHNVVELKELVVEACVTNCPLQRRGIARSFQLLMPVTPSFVDLILKLL